MIIKGKMTASCWKYMQNPSLKKALRPPGSLLELFLHYRKPAGLAAMLWLSVALCLASAYCSHAGEADVVKLTAEERSWLDRNPEKLTLLFNVDYPPIEFSSASGEFKGMGADIIAMVERRLGVTFIKQPSHDWSEHMADLESGACAITPAIVSKPERQRYAFFTRPYATAPLVIITKDLQHDNLTLDGLGGRRVAVVAGLATETYLRDVARDRFEVVPVPTATEGVRIVSLGQADAYMGNLAMAAYHIEKEGISNLRVAGKTDYVYAWSIGVSRKYPLLFSAIRKTLDTIPEHEIEVIRKRWISLDMGSWFEPGILRLMKVLGVFSVLVLMGLMGIAFILKRRLKEKVVHLKASQQELLDQSELLKLAMEVTQASVWDCRPAKKITRLSKQWNAMLGYAPIEKEIPLSEFKNYVHPQDLPLLARSFRDYISSGGNGQFEAEFRLRRADDTWCWVLSRGKTVAWDEKGAPSRIIGLNVNTQTIKEAQEKMNQSEVLFRAIFENAPYSISINSLDDGRYVKANKTFLDGRGVSREELVHLKVADFAFVSEEERKDIVDTLMRTGAVKNREATITRKDGSTSHIVYSSVLLDIQGQRQVLSMTVDVTEKKLAEEALKESEARFRNLFMAAPIPLVNVAMNGEFIAVNDCLTQVLGYTIEEIPDLDHWWEIIYPDPEYRRHVKTTWEKAVSQAVSDNSGVAPDEYRLTCKNGAVLTMTISANITGNTALVSFYDITDRRAKELALQESMEMLRATFNATTDGILVVNKDLKVTQVNQQFYRMWQMPPELQESDDDTTLRAFAQDQMADPEGFQNRVKRLYYSQLQDMWEILLKDGRVFECYSAPIIMEGEETGRVWDFRDISERKQAEEALRDSEKKLRSIFSAMRDVIMIFDGEGCCLEIAPTNSGLLYRPSDEVLGKSLRDIFPAEKACEFLSAIKSSLSLGKPVFLDYELNIGSRQVWFASSVSPLSPGQVIMVARDITERKHAGEERERLQGQLHQSKKLEAVGILAGGVAHDFNNMLGVIMGYAEITLGDMDPDDPFRKNLERILDAAQRSANLTRQLLTFARKQTIEPVVFDLNESVEALLKMVRRLIGENIDLAWLPGAARCTVKMDPTQLDQILVNLCVNARDAIAGVGRVTIETDTVSFDASYCESHAEFVPGEYVLLAISDNGQGMDKETLNHIFEPFYTTKGLGQGTGMGLATVYGIVKQNAGLISVFSEPGKGTIFRIYIPLNTVEDLAARPERVEDIPRSQGETILVIEDDPSLLELIRKMLEQLGYSVLSAGTPGQAIRIAEESSADIHLFVTDVVMPEMNGRDLAHLLQEIRPDIKHLFMSGYTANLIAHQGVLDEGVNFIQKPFSLKDMSLKIREILGSHGT